MKGSLALIYGGRGLEREVSILGADFVLPLIEKAGYGCIPVYITEDGRWSVYRRGDEFLRPDKFGVGECAGLINMGGRGGLCLGGEIIAIDCAFPLLHGDFGEDGSVQGALVTAAIPFVGEDIFTSALCLDKAACRTVSDALSIPGAKWFSPPLGMSAPDFAKFAEQRLGYPMFLKPRYLGSSIGAGRAECREELEGAYMYATDNLTRQIIVEEAVDIDCELEIGVIRSKGKYIFTKTGQIKNKGGFYSFGEKYSPCSSAELRSSFAPSVEVGEAVGNMSRALACALSLRSLSRIDFFLDKKGKIYFNEINTMPGFTGASLFPKMFSEMGISPVELVDTLICEAVS